MRLGRLAATSVAVGTMLFVVTACSSTTQSSKPVPSKKQTTTTLTADQANAVSEYRTYLQHQADDLVTRTKGLADSVDAGNVRLAFGMYAQTHSSYERIRPIAADVGDLDNSINVAGFHQLEQAFWTEDSTEGMQPVAQKLVDDVTALRTKVSQVHLEPAQIADGAGKLLRQTSQSAVTGDLERFSRTDLYDISAHVDGSKAATDALRPLLDKVDPAVGKDIDAKFTAVEAALEPHRREIAFVSYTTLKPDDTQKISGSIESLAGAVTDASTKLAAEN